MNTKLYVLSAVLGAVPFCHARDEAPQGGLSRQAVVPPAGPAAEVAPSKAPGLEPGVPTHPCELITVMQVPCDPATAVCEYTYWECPQSVNPLRA